MGQPVGSRLGFGTMITDHFRAKIDRSEHPPLVLFTAAMDMFPVGNQALNWASDSTTLNLKTLRESLPQMVTLGAFTELEGKGKLELDHHKLDAFGSPVAKVTMTMTDWDRGGSKKVGDLADQLAEAMGTKNISKNTSPEYGLGLHPAGATAMAKNPDEGVCDKNLKVFGLENLYIVSSSVFPHMAANPPTLTIVALALRIAEHLEGKNKL
jgi:choline dehydrogenase-like flavoprotein